MTKPQMGNPPMQSPAERSRRRMAQLANSPWTPEKTAKLRSLEGHTSREIAEILGVSRNAVVGKASRMGVPLYRRAGTRPWP